MTNLADIYRLLEKYVEQANETSIFEVVNALGSVATFFTFVYLIWMDYKKSKRIGDLERVAMTLEKDLHLRYQPHLWLNGLQTRPVNEVNFDINNKGAWCKLIEYNISGDLIFTEPNMPKVWELEQPFNANIIGDTTRVWIFTTNNSGKAIRDLEAEIEITYEDRLLKKYSVVIKLVGTNYTLSAPIEVK